MTAVRKHSKRKLHMRIEINTLTAEDFRTLFEAVGWEAPGLQQIDTALQNSIATFTALDGDRPVGMARLLGDRSMSFYIKAFAVLPDCQGRGIGRMLMKQMEDYILEQLEDGWAVSLEFISSKGREAFYEKFGFEQRPCEWDGAGMFRMLKKQTGE